MMIMSPLNVAMTWIPASDILYLRKLYGSIFDLDDVVFLDSYTKLHFAYLSRGVYRGEVGATCVQFGSGKFRLPGEIFIFVVCNCTSYRSCLLCAEKLYLFSGKSQKILQPKVLFLAQMCTKILCRLGLRHWGAYSAPRPPSSTWGLLLRVGAEGKGRRGRERD